MTSTLRRVLALLVVGLALIGCGKDRSAEGAGPVKVAAAADLGPAFKEIAAAFEKKTGKKVTLSFGSTGNFAKQIAEGARYDLFAAANVSFVDDVIKAGACDAETKAPYARGRIVLWSKDGGVAPPKTIADLADPRFVKIAIANPEHAPYGRAAKQALGAAGVWDAVERRIVNGENVQQTLQFAQTGNVEVAVVALSLALATTGGSYVLVDDALHAPLDQALVVCKHGSDPSGGRELAAFVGSPEGREIMKRYGFALPGEAVAGGDTPAAATAKGP